jgi:putative component of toxin-antitoxin plasmid stabilization module
MKAATLSFYFLWLLLMCASPGSGSGGQVSNAPVAAAAAPTTQPEWTKKLVERKKEGISPVTLRQVSAAEQGDFDRVVFEFKDNQVPGYRVEYVPIVTDEAETVHKLFGKAFMRVDMNPAWAHSNETGAPSVKEREKRLNLPVVIEFKQVEDFEGVVSYALGLSGRKPFRVMEMSNPARLVIDVKH